MNTASCLSCPSWSSILQDALHRCDDLIEGKGSGDTLYGGADDDVLDGGEGGEFSWIPNSLFGEDGDDTLIAGAAGSRMEGGAGADTYVLSPGQWQFNSITDDGGRIVLADVAFGLGWQRARLIMVWSTAALTVGSLLAYLFAWLEHMARIEQRQPSE